MIALVENVLSDVIQSKLKAIKSDPSVIDRIFKNTSVSMKTKLKEYIGNGKIAVIRGFPSDRAKIPCYTILLGGEQEQQKNLGSYIGESDELYNIENISEAQPIFLNGERVFVRTSKKAIADVDFITFKGEEIPFTVLNHGTGLVELGSSLNKGDMVSIDYSYNKAGSSSYGSIFSTQYRIETWTNNGDLTVMLYHLLKWILLTSRDLFEQDGFQLQTLGGMDFEPAPEYFPEFVYRRALTFECLTEYSYEVDYSFIESIQLKGEIWYGNEKEEN